MVADKHLVKISLWTAAGCRSGPLAVRKLIFAGVPTSVNWADIGGVEDYPSREGQRHPAGCMVAAISRLN